MRGARAEAEISVPFRTRPDVEALSRALFPEIVSQKTGRTCVRVEARGRVLTMKFLAKDVIALRAVLNSFLRLAASWRRISEATGHSRED